MKVTYIIVLFAVAIVISCAEQEKFGLVESVRGFNFRAIPDVNSFDISLGDPEITFTLYSQNKDIKQVNVWVELNQFATQTITDRVLLKTINGKTLTNNGSSKLSISLSEFAEAVELTHADLQGGDIFTIYNEVEMDDGRVYPDSVLLGGKPYVNMENSFSTTAVSTSYTYQLSFPVLCPFLVDEAVGTYAVTRDDFETYLDPSYKPEIVEGANPGEIIIKNIFGHPEPSPGAYDIIVKVNPNTDVATVVKQDAWLCSNFASTCTLGTGYVEGAGFFFSCTGFLTLDLKQSVDAGNYGTFKLELTKEN